MPKTITSPVEYFAGEVVLYDPLSFDQAIAVEAAFDEVKALGKNPSRLKVNRALVSAILPCVKEWRLKNISAQPESLPATPRMPSAILVAWLINEISALFQEQDEIPNA